jgi:hypothetical protein
MQVNNPFFTIGTVMTAASPALPLPPAAQISTAVAAMNAACFGPGADMQRCALLSQSVGRLRGMAQCQGGSGGGGADAASAAALAAVSGRTSTKISGPTVMAALAALGSTPSTAGLARIC